MSRQAQQHGEVGSGLVLRAVQYDACTCHARGAAKSAEQPPKHTIGCNTSPPLT